MLSKITSKTKPGVTRAVGPQPDFLHEINDIVEMQRDVHQQCADAHKQFEEELQKIRDTGVAVPRRKLEKLLLLKRNIRSTKADLNAAIDRRNAVILDVSKRPHCMRS